MVMVTHDVALRAFAHRVIHMLDGKVQRVEAVPASVRARALRELRAVTVETTVNDVDDGSSTPVPVSAVSQREVLEKAKTFTSVRKPGACLPSPCEQCWGLGRSPLCALTRHATTDATCH